jgi:cyanophycin synthetase
MAADAQTSPGGSLVELRVLEGPNLYFPRPAIKLTLDVTRLLGLPEEQIPGEPGSEQRRRFVTRLLARLTRRVAAAAGVRSLAVRSRPGPAPTQVVVA